MVLLRAASKAPTGSDDASQVSVAAFKTGTAGASASTSAEARGVEHIIHAPAWLSSGGHLPRIVARRASHHGGSLPRRRRLRDRRPRVGPRPRLVAATLRAGSSATVGSGADGWAHKRRRSSRCFDCAGLASARGRAGGGRGAGANRGGGAGSERGGHETWSWPRPRPAVAETESPWEASAVVACAAGVDPGQVAPEEENHTGARMLCSTPRASADAEAEAPAVPVLTAATETADACVQQNRSRREVASSRRVT